MTAERHTAPLLISVAQAAKLLNIGRGLCYQLVQEGRLPSVRLGRRVLVSRLALESWVLQEVGAIAADGVSSGQTLVHELEEG